MKSRRISVSAKLLGMAGIAAILTVVVGVLAIKSLGSVDEKGASMYSNGTLPIERLGTVSTTLVDQHRGLLRTLLLDDPAITAPEKKVYARNAATIDEELTAYGSTSLLPAEKTNLTKLRSAIAAYRGLHDRVLSAFEHGESAKANELTKQALAASEQARTAAGALVKINRDEAKDLNRQIA